MSRPDSDTQPAVLEYARKWSNNVDDWRQIVAKKKRNLGETYKSVITKQRVSAHGCYSTLKILSNDILQNSVGA